VLPLVGRLTGGSVHSEEAGREDSAPKSFLHRDADAVSLAEGSIRKTDNARLPGVAGVPSPGHAFKRTSREPRRAADLSRAGYGFCPTQKEPGPEGNEGVPREANRPSTWSTCCQGRPEVAGMGRQQSYDPIVPTQCRVRHCVRHADWRIMPNGFAKTPCSRGFVAGRAIVVLLPFGIV